VISGVCQHDCDGKLLGVCGRQMFEDEAHE
jgi:hypothetical protein